MDTFYNNLIDRIPKDIRDEYCQKEGVNEPTILKADDTIVYDYYSKLNHYYLYNYSGVDIPKVVWVTKKYLKEQGINYSSREAIEKTIMEAIEHKGIRDNLVYDLLSQTNGHVGFCVMTEYVCSKCGVKAMYGSSNVPKVCNTCVTTDGLQEGLEELIKPYIQYKV